MKNVQVIDGAQNATFSVFQATDEEFALLFPNGTDVAFCGDVESRLTEKQQDDVFGALWSRPVDKKTIHGIHGTYFADLDERQFFFPTRMETEVLDRGPEVMKASRKADKFKKRAKAL